MKTAAGKRAEYRMEGMRIINMRLLLFLALIVGVTRYDLFPQSNLYTLTDQRDYDGVIAATTDAVANPSSAQNHETLMLAGKAYYDKGRMLLAGYSAAQVLADQYFTCKFSKDTKTQGQFFSFEQGMLELIRKDYNGALSHFVQYRKTSVDKAWTTRASICIGVLEEVLGKTGERDKAWQGIDWKTPANITERLMLSAVLGLKQSQGPPMLPSSLDVKDPIVARNLLIIPQYLEHLTLAEKVRLSGLLQWKEPLYFKQSNGMEEKYYDIFAYLAGGRAALSISKDIMANGMKLLTTEEKKKFSTLPFIMGWTSYLLDDMTGAASFLESDKDPRSAVLLGAIAYRNGDSNKADGYWLPIEQGKDFKAQSWLGYIYALLNIRLNKASELSSRFLDDAEGLQNKSQDYFERCGMVLERRGEVEVNYRQKEELLTHAREIFMHGYRADKDGQFGKYANEPDYTVLYCAALERVDGTQMFNVNKTLAFTREKYTYFVPLHEIATSFSICREVRAGK